jgi:hypothetical protein
MDGMSFTMDRYNKVTEFFNLPICINIIQFLDTIVCLRIAFKKKVEKNKMMTLLNTVEGQASCTNERYLF